VGKGVESCWRPYSAGVSRSISGQIQNLKNCHTTQNKLTRRGEGLRQIKTCRKVPLPRSIFLDDDILLWCLYNYLVYAPKLPRRAFKSLFGQAFQPGLVLVSAGFDATAGHPAALGGYSVSPACFGLMTTSLLQAVGGKVGSIMPIKNTERD
jgi:hypothetical protein